MKGVFVFLMLLTGSASAAPGVEEILAANANQVQRPGMATNGQGCWLEIDGNDPNYQFLVLGGTADESGPGPAWYSPYGGPKGKGMISAWSINENNLEFRMNSQGDTVTLTFDPQTLIINRYKSDFSSQGYGVADCQIGK
jgi:hypothetical protein